jgi:hypothetical protein
MQDRGGLAAGPGHRCATGVGLEASGVGEAGAVVADLGQDAGAGQRTEAGHADEDRRVRVLGKAFSDPGREVLGVGAGGVELAQQGEGLMAEGLLHERGVVQVLGAQHLVEPFGLGVGCRGTGRRVPRRDAAALAKGVPGVL